MSEFVPAFDFVRVFIAPWRDGFEGALWVVLMGALVGTACGLVGTFLLLRRMALVGDAISHSVLLGLVGVFLVFGSAPTPLMFGGAVAAGMLTVGIIEFIHRQSRVKADAAICIAFTTLFALAVLMISLAERAGPVLIDADCVLFGEIAFVALEPRAEVAGVALAPAPVVRMALVTLAVAAVISVFYKELLVTSFDPGLAASMGMRNGVWHYGLMAVLSVVVVSALEAVGAILAVALLVVPAMFAAQLSTRLPVRLLLAAANGCASALLGFHLSVWLDCSTAGAMAAVSAGLFLVAWASAGAVGVFRLHVLRQMGV